MQEHGDLIPLMQAIKASFDPNGILNPGKVLPEKPVAASRERPRQPYRLGVDIGGTFTDVVLLGDDGSVRTPRCSRRPDDYARGVVDGAVALLAEHATSRGDEIAGVVHASTVASNTILEGLGARTALVTTKGFRDVLEMRRLRIPVLYDIQYQSPQPLVPRRLRYEVTERLGPRGETWTELDEATVREVAEQIRRGRRRGRRDRAAPLLRRRRARAARRGDRARRPSARTST